MVKRPGKVERRRRILDAARTVFARHGFAATRMSDVATQAKVGKGTLYEYFRGKEELFASLVLTAARESLEALNYKGKSSDPVEALREAIRYTVETALGENLDLYRLFFDFWGVAAQHRLDAQQHLREIHASWSGFIGDLLRDGQRAGVFRPELDPRQYAAALAAAVDGTSLRIVVLGDAVDLAAYSRCLEEVFVVGILTDDALRGASILTEKESSE